MDRQSLSEKEESRPLQTDGSKVTNTQAHLKSTVAGDKRQDQLLRDIEEVSRILSRYSFDRLKEPVLRHTTYGLLPIRTITESMEYAINHPDEDTPGSGRAGWGYLKEKGGVK